MICMEPMLVILLLVDVMCVKLSKILQSLFTHFFVVKTSYPNKSEALFFYPVRVRRILSLFCLLYPSNLRMVDTRGGGSHGRNDPPPPPPEPTPAQLLRIIMEDCEAAR